MSATFGESFGITGRRVASRRRSTRRGCHSDRRRTGCRPASRSGRRCSVRSGHFLSLRQIRDLRVLLDRRPHTFTNCGAALASRGSTSFTNRHPDALQADRVQQPRWRFGDPRRGGPSRGFSRGPSRRSRQVPKDPAPLVLDAVTKGARGGDERVLQRGRRSRPKGPASFLPYHSAPSNTGP